MMTYVDYAAPCLCLLCCPVPVPSEPSLPSRAECEALLAGKPLPSRPAAAPSTLGRSDAKADAKADGTAAASGVGSAARPAKAAQQTPPPPKHGAFISDGWAASDLGECPLAFGSRLNSMKVVAIDCH